MFGDLGVRRIAQEQLGHAAISTTLNTDDHVARSSSGAITQSAGRRRIRFVAVIARTTCCMKIMSGLVSSAQVPTEDAVFLDSVPVQDKAHGARIESC